MYLDMKPVETELINERTLLLAPPLTPTYE
jgi:hypothetical protein